MKLKSCRTVNAILAGIFLALGIGLLWLIPVVCKDNGFFMEGLNAPKDFAVEGLKSLYNFDFSNLVYIVVLALLGLSAIFTICWIINSFVSKKGGHTAGAIYALLIVIVIAAVVMSCCSLKWVYFLEYNPKDPLASLLSVEEGTFLHCVLKYGGEGKFLFKVMSLGMMAMFALAFIFVVLYAFMDFFGLVADGVEQRAEEAAQASAEPVVEEEPVVKEEPAVEEELVVEEEPVVEEEIVVEEEPVAESNIKIVPEGSYVIRDKKTREELFFKSCVDTGDYVVFDEVDFGAEDIEELDDVKILKELHVK